LNVTGKSDEEWKDVFGYISNLKNEENNVIKVLQDSEEVAAIFFQLDKQRRLPEIWESCSIRWHV
jgi:uncharacterized protein YfbU (UPF0304 family)